VAVVAVAVVAELDAHVHVRVAAERHGAVVETAVGLAGVAVVARLAGLLRAVGRAPEAGRTRRGRCREQDDGQSDERTHERHVSTLPGCLTAPSPPRESRPANPGRSMKI